MEIRGPSNLQILEVQGRKFFLFGDIHNRLDTTCDKNAIQIDELLANMLTMYENNDIPCDVFLEQSYTKESHRRPQKEASYLKITTNRFRDCLSSLKTQCPYKNIRFNYTDIRSVITTKGEENTSVIDILTEIDSSNMLDIARIGNEILSNILYYVNIELTSQNYLEDVKSSKIFQLNFSSPQTKQKVDRVLLTSKIVGSKIDGRMMSRVGKNLYKLRPDVRNQLYFYILGKILHFSQLDNTLVEDIQNKVVSKEILQKRCQRLKARCMRISGLLMDCYTISRMLQQIPQNDRCIAYLGKYHIDTLTDFFTQHMDAKVLESIDSGRDRCLKSQYLMNEI
jgi:hypothetical protein